MSEEVKNEEIKDKAEETEEETPKGTPAAGEEAPQQDTVAESSEEGKQEDSRSAKSKREERREEKRKAKKLSKEEEKIAALEEEQAAMNDRYLRLCAEYDNFRKRSQKEKDSLYGDIKASTVTQFLPVYDNLERALKQGTEDEAYRKGVEMIMTQFCTTLEKLGVTPIECLGEKFDPTMHNAVMHVDDEEKGENEIVEVFQKGFKLGDKVIRFAMVKVAN